VESTEGRVFQYRKPWEEKQTRKLKGTKGLDKCCDRKQETGGGSNPKLSPWRRG
jgi:hypothetical protein